MEIGEITDLDKLGHMAYKEIQKIEQAQANLRVIQGRMAQVEGMAEKEPEEAEIVEKADERQS